MVHQLLNGHNMIIITGASRSIGKYLHEKYSKEEVVFGTYFSTPPTDSLLKNNLFHVDVSNYDSVEQFFLSIKEKIGRASCRERV